MQIVHGLAHHRNGSIAVAAPGALPGGRQLGDRVQEENTLAQPDIAGLRHQVQPATTVGRGVPTQQHNTQRVFGHAQCDIVAGSRGLQRLLARAHRGVIGPKHAVLYRQTVGPGDDTREGCRVAAVSGHRDGVVEVLAPPGTAQPPPSTAAPCQRGRQR